MNRGFSKESKLNLINGAKKSAQIQKQRKQKRILAYKLNPTLCAFCNFSLPYNKRHYKFCNHSCAASHNNKGTVRNGLLRKKECKVCGTITSNEIYCSSICHRSFEWDKLKKEIETTGVINAHVTGKKYLQEVRGDNCEICGLKEWQSKKIVMVMDHIDGDSTNNSLLNLRLICPNCDSQTPTYKGRNKGRGRYSRRKRYAEGKSF